MSGFSGGGGVIIPVGQCVLAQSGSNLVLSPKNGNLLQINGALWAVPDAGVTLTTSGLSASTFDYVYAYMSSGTMTLEAVTTAPVVSTTAGNKGIKIKTGDDTRTLVGCCYMSAGTAFVDTAANRTVLSWFNRVNKRGLNGFTTARTFSSNTAGEINTEIRIQFLLWADEGITVNANVYLFDNTATNQVLTGIAIDSTTTTYYQDAACYIGATSVYYCGNSSVVIAPAVLTEAAVHYATLNGRASGGGHTATWDAKTFITTQTNG